MITFVSIISVLTFILSIVVIYQNEENKLEQIKREDELKKWLFKSLYSISPKVLLPNEANKSIVKQKAEVYSPEEDPMQEFRNGIDDYFGDNNGR